VMTTSAPHVVLGGNGAVGRETLLALLKQGKKPVSVGRRPSTIQGAQAHEADLLDAQAVGRVLEGAAVAYLTAGLPYSTRVWAKQWPVIVRNASEAALQYGTHLVYLDNVYAYGRVDTPMTEQTPLRPSSTKGAVRAAALHLLERASDRGLSLTIARSADFYGPATTTSVFNTFALDRIATGKDGTWLFDADQPHSLTYTPDIGRALALLGSSPAAPGRVWHLPTSPALTGRDYIELAAGPGARTKVMGATTMRMGALFNRAARETVEMAYQYTDPYIFDSTPFQSTYDVAPTPIADGIAATLASIRATIEACPTKNVQP
jgi:nucleoside-diphosphate-sugar epimerase